MSKIKQSGITLWVIASRPYAEKILDNLFLDPQEADTKCSALNQEFQLATNNTHAAPYKVYTLNGLMTETQALIHVDAAVEELRKLQGLWDTVKVESVYGEGSHLYEPLRKHLNKIEEVRYLLVRHLTLGQLFERLIDLQNPTYALSRAQEEHLKALENVPRPYPKGSIIEYAEDMLGELVEDHGSSVVVKFEGEVVKWYWNYDDATCRLAALPSV